MKLPSRNSFASRMLTGLALASTDEVQDSVKAYRRLVISAMYGGFTLIELLVVVAIIGLLSSIVLVSLNAARTKGSGAAIQKEMVSIRQAAELYYQSHADKYSVTTGSCTKGMFADTATNMRDIVASISTEAGGASNLDCASSANAWSVAVKLPSGDYLCVDSGDVLLSASRANGRTYTGLYGASGNVAHLSATANTATVCH